MQNFRKILFSLLAILFFGVANAQEMDPNGYNENSLRPVHKFDQMYKRTLWWRLDLTEKPNRPFSASSNEVTKIVIDAVKAGIIRPFENDSLKERMSYEDFIKNLQIPGSDSGGDFDSGSDEFGGDTGGGDSWGDDSWGGGSSDGGGDGTGAEDTTGGGSADESGGGAQEYFTKDLTILELREDLIFDKRRSRMIHDIQAITIKIPSKLHPAGLELPLASFSYKELVDNVFKENPAAIWYNPDGNLAEHRNFGEAFEMRLFMAHLFKVANWDDAAIEDIYGSGKASVVSGQNIEFELADYEQDLWEN